jgi:O-acetyl-ADP-ribose deacetylase (regulator of RNase III)
MLKYCSGNIFSSQADALVNPVNCIGVMGAGLALQFKKAFPQSYEAYRKFCLERKLKIGGIFVFQTPFLIPKYIIHLPTKYHWRDKSNLKIIRLALFALNDLIPSLEIKSTAIPKLGCGLGGLKWEQVKPLMEEILAKVNGEIMIYE